MRASVTADRTHGNTHNKPTHANSHDSYDKKSATGAATAEDASATVTAILRDHDGERMAGPADKNRRPHEAETGIIRPCSTAATEASSAAPAVHEPASAPAPAFACRLEMEACPALEEGLPGGFGEGLESRVTGLAAGKDPRSGGGEVNGVGSSSADEAKERDRLVEEILSLMGGEFSSLSRALSPPIPSLCSLSQRLSILNSCLFLATPR